MDLTKIQLQTPRLLLVPVSTKYTEQIYAEYREPLTKYMNHTSTGPLVEFKKRMEKREAEIKEGKMLFVAVLAKESGEFLGCFALENLDSKTPEMGGWLKKTAHGNHYGQEAAAALKAWADLNLDYDHIIWPCAAANLPSRKVAESLGGKIAKEYDKKMASGKVWPSVEYWIK